MTICIAKPRYATHGLWDMVARQTSYNISQKSKIIATKVVEFILNEILVETFKLTYETKMFDSKHSSGFNTPL